MVAPTITFLMLFSITLSYSLILKEDDSRRKPFCFYQFQRHLTHFLKEPLSAPQHNRIDQESVYIDEIIW